MWRQENPSECNESDESALPLRRGPRAFKTLCRFVNSDAKLCSVLHMYIHIYRITDITMGLDHYNIINSISYTLIPTILRDYNYMKYF